MRLLFVVAFLQVLSLQNCFALLEEDQENKKPSPLLSPYSKLDKALSPVRGALARKVARKGSVSPLSIKKAYEKHAPKFIENPIWFDSLLFDKEKSLPKMEKGRSGVSYKGEIMELHHLYQTDDSPLIYLPRSIHRSLEDRYIVVEKLLKPQKVRVVKTRLTLKEARKLKRTFKHYIIESNSLHPYRGPSLVDRNQFNSKRRKLTKKVARSLKEDII